MSIGIPDLNTGAGDNPMGHNDAELMHQSPNEDRLRTTSTIVQSG
jgi:hypothetical protein